MKMKKVCSAIAAAALALTMSVSAFAAGSGYVDGVVEDRAEGTDNTGSAVSIVVETPNATVPMTATEAAAVTEVEDANQSAGLVSAVLGSDYNTNMKVTDVKNVTVTSVNGGTVTFPVTLTFNVAGILPTSKAYLIHFNDATGEWEKIPTVCGNGTMTGTFNSLSPVAFVIDTTTTQSTLPTPGTPSDGGSSEPSSPKTGESNAVLFFAVALAGVGVFAARKFAVER